MNNWIQLEVTDIYDGWILEYNPETKEIKWRDHYIVQRLSDKEKLEIEKWVKND